MTFRVGQKVVCVRDDWDKWPGYVPASLPRAGHVYIIRSIVENLIGAISFRFAGMVNPLVNLINPPRGLSEPSFAAENDDGTPNFYPLVERSTDAGFAILKKLEIPSNHLIKEHERLMGRVLDAAAELRAALRCKP